MTEGVLPTAPGRAEQVYSKVLDDMLSSEMVRKASIEQRGLSVISTSGVLISLLVGLAALLIGRDSTATFSLPSRLLLIGAATLFISASVFALAANAPRDYGTFNDEDLDRIVDRHAWAGDLTEARYLISQAKALQIKAALSINNRKATHVLHAIIAQVLSVGLVAGAILVSLAVGS